MNLYNQLEETDFSAEKRRMVFYELDKRFIKANLKRYINRDPIIIHENKLMQQ